MPEVYVAPTPMAVIGPANTAAGLLREAANCCSQAAALAYEASGACSQAASVCTTTANQLSAFSGSLNSFFGCVHASDNQLCHVDIIAHLADIVVSLSSPGTLADGISQFDYFTSIQENWIESRCGHSVFDQPGECTVEMIASLYGFGKAHEEEGAWRHYAIEGSTTLYGFDVGASAEGNVLGYSFEQTSKKLTIDDEDGYLGAETGVELKGYLAGGKLTSNFGICSQSLEGSIGEVSATGKIGATLYENGKLDPSVFAEVEAKAAAATGSYENKIGTDNFNYHNKAEGTLLGAEANAKFGFGEIETGKDGEKKYGLVAEAGAEAYLAEGKLSGGITIFGIEINASVEGKAGGVGAKVGTEMTNTSAKGEIGLGLGLGAGVEIEIDWSDFSWSNLIFW